MANRSYKRDARGRFAGGGSSGGGGKTRASRPVRKGKVAFARIANEPKHAARRAFGGTGKGVRTASRLQLRQRATRKASRYTWS